MSARSFRRNHERAIEKARRRRTTLAGTAGAAVAATVLFAPGASAATFTVNTTADGDDGSCADDDCTLREAAEEANQAAGADVITFASNVTGTIALSASLEQINLYEDAVEIQGPGANVLTVSGEDDDGIFKLFGFTAADTPVRISGLSLANGEQANRGGAAINSYAGGGFTAALTVADSRLVDNTVLDGVDSTEDGGAIRSLYGDVTITNSELSGNYSYDDGGAVFVDEGALTITGSTFSNNSSYNEGGAVYIQDTPGGATDFRVADSTFTGNEALDDEGGAIYIDGVDGGSVIERSTISNNTAYDEGGGVYVSSSNDGAVTIDSTTISGNEAEDGGGVYLDPIDYSVTIRNSTISGNDADTSGGGISVGADDDTDDDISIRNSTIAGNSAVERGGGLYQDVYYNGVSPRYIDDVDVSSTIIANNTAAVGPDVAQQDEPIDEGTLSIGFSLIETTAGATFTGTAPNLTGVDPQLGPLAANGGPTLTHAPSFTSPVIDKGIGNGLATDQRGSARTFDAANFANAAGGDGTDIGSVELLPGGRVSAALAQCKGKVENLLFAPGTAIVGTDANDVIVGTSANDQINSGKGKDTVCAQGGNDSVKAGAGKDNVAGQAGKDRLKGNGGNDKLQGNAGRDTLKGGGGKDTLKGGGGKDKLRGGPGKDKLRGGGGKDSEVQ